MSTDDRFATYGLRTPKSQPLGASHHAEQGLIAVGFAVVLAVGIPFYILLMCNAWRDAVLNYPIAIEGTVKRVTSVPFGKGSRHRVMIEHEGRTFQFHCAKGAGFNERLGQSVPLLATTDGAVVISELCRSQPKAIAAVAISSLAGIFFIPGLLVVLWRQLSAFAEDLAYERRRILSRKPRSREVS